ncbi:MAG: DUF3592 domain-containing protein [Fulvivirga sp.]
MNVTVEQKEKTKDLIRAGKSIEAIKYVRSELNLDLKTATRLVRALRETIDPAEIQPETRILKKGSKAIPSIFIIIGLIAIGAAFFVYTDQHNIINQGNKTVATVVSNPANPLFEYEFEGTTYTHQSSTSSDPPSYYVGEQVDVYINASDPYDIVIDTFTDRWLVVVIFGSIGSTFLGVSLLVFYVGRK